MNDLIRRIDHCARRHPQLAIALFIKLEKAAISEQQVSLALNALVRRFFIYERTSGAVAMSETLQTGLQQAEAAGLPYQAGKLMLCLGRVRYTQGVYNEAIHFWTRCIDLCKVTHDIEVLIEARIGLGQIYDALGDWETGARFHQDAGLLLERFDRPYLKAKQCISLGVNHVHLGKLSEARALFDDALHHAERDHITEYVAETHWQLAVLTQKENRLEEAYERAVQALQLARRGPYQWLLGAAANTVGEILGKLNRPQEALEIYLEALTHAEKVESREQRAHCANALSLLYEQLDQAGTALHYARLHHRLISEIAELSILDRFRDLREYDLSRKPPVELLLELSSDSQLDEKSLQEALHHICSAALTILQIDMICLWMRDKTTQELHCLTLCSEIDVPFVAGKTIQQQDYLRYFQVIENLQTPIATHDLRIHPAAHELAQLYAGCELHSLLEIALRMHGEHIGVISFAKSGRQKDWTREDVLFGSHLANLVQEVLSHEEYRQAQSRLENRVSERTKELQQQTELLRTAHNNIFILSEIGREITAQLDRESIMSTLYQHVIKLMPAQGFAIGAYKPDQALIEFPCAIFQGKNLPAYQHDMDDPDLLPVWCVKHRREIYINDIHEDYVHYIGMEGLEKIVQHELAGEDINQNTPQSLIYVPLIVKDRLLGLIAVQSHQAYAFERMHVDMLTTLAAYTAVAFDNADTYQQLSSAQQLLMSKEKLAALGALVAGVAHEINTPLGNCLLTATTLRENSTKFLEQLEGGSLKRSGMNQFTHVLIEANEMLMRNLLTASDLVSSFKQVSVDQTSQQRRRFKLQQTSQEIVRTMQARINKQGHHLELHIPPHITIDSYPGPYGQVLTNLINNALIHGLEDRRDGKMVLSAEEVDNDQIRISFIDNGKGIKPEHLRRVFDPFFTTKLGHGGSGLGM
ncbi:MAG: GAF domain-containing protein, partial [Burkholderiales bacterium]|nr:GAF domain-containing protein [Burkholderiales bacterium]